MKKKTYVITLSQRFPATHPRKGQETNFAEYLREGIKKQTIRGNYPFWKKRVDEINAGRAVLSIRQWSGKPYASKQFELMQLDTVGIQKCDVDAGIFIDGVFATGKQTEIITNDGLSLCDFNDWFTKSLIGGCIIHFTDLRY